MADNVYHKFATVYDLMGADSFSRKMVPYCCKILDHFKAAPQTGLDLCCGTGSALQMLSRLGLDMCGVDRSPEMLAIAARKLKGCGVTLYQKELPRFRVLDTDGRSTRRFDLVTSFYDSLNYLKSESQLGTAFKTVARHLNDSGWFVFDMNTAAALKLLWDEQIWADTRDDLAWIWKNVYRPQTRSATCHATFFVRRGKAWERFDEAHNEYAYSNTVIKKLLREAGFRIRGFYRCLTFENATRDAYRICAVAQKKQVQRKTQAR